MKLQVGHRIVASDDSAAPHYRELLALEPDSLFTVDQGRGFYVDLRAYLESLVEKPYQGGPREILRTIKAQPNVPSSMSVETTSPWGVSTGKNPLTPVPVLHRRVCEPAR